MGIRDLLYNRKFKIIDSRDSMEEAVVDYGVLPFFHNGVRGFSIAEMTLPGLLFGGNDGYEGCWEWKGPVIREKTAAYGKFFNKKAGFVSLELLPDFLNYRRTAYPVKEGSTEEIILDIIRENDSLTSTELKRYIFGFPSGERRPWDLPVNDEIQPVKKKKPSIETPLQKLQMGGRIIISDFEYKLTKRGEKYGWGVARYSTPESWFGKDFIKPDISPEESFERIINILLKRVPGSNRQLLRKLLK